MKLIDTSIFTDFSTQFNMTQLDEHDKNGYFEEIIGGLSFFYKNYKKMFCFSYYYSLFVHIVL